MNRRGFLRLLLGGLAVATVMGVPAVLTEPVRKGCKVYFEGGGSAEMFLAC